MSLKKLIVFFLLFLITPILTSASEEATNPKQINQRITLNFQSINVRDVLQILSQFSGFNIIISDSVKGDLTLHLKDIPWQQALDIILQTQGLGKQQIGNVLLIAPIDEIAAHQKQELEAEQQLQDLGPLQSALIQIHYGKANNIQ